jgi:hypothetical protein
VNHERIILAGLLAFSLSTPGGGEGRGEAGAAHRPRAANAGPLAGGKALLTLTLSSLKEGGEGTKYRCRGRFALHPIALPRSGLGLTRAARATAQSTIEAGIERGSGMDWGKLTQAERDAAYNNSLAVPGSAEMNEARSAASATFRDKHPGALDLPYGPLPRNKWDLFPAADPAAPCLVFIHGGYWQRNTREGFGILMEGVRAHGWSAALPGYTLAPEASLAQIVAEVGAALDWLGEHGSAHGIAGRIVVSGWSAGGHLTAMAVSHPAVSAGLAISGVFELGPIRDTYLNEKLRLTDEEIATLSPLRLPVVPKRLSIAYGSRELAALVGDSRALHAMRAAAHAPGALLPIAEANHFTVLDALRSPDGELTRHLLTLV